jgi:phenylacetic acid degradation operon negative regulatory protein
VSTIWAYIDRLLQSFARSAHDILLAATTKKRYTFCMELANLVSHSGGAGGSGKTGPDATPAERIERWIRADLATFPPRAKSLVITVWGDAIAPHGGRAWLSGFIRLMQPLGCNERLVRTSVFRLAQEGWLVARQDGRRSQYRLTPSGKRRFAHAYQRVYAMGQQTWDGLWDVIVMDASIGGASRRNFRGSLAWEGFAMAAPGVFVRPARAQAENDLEDVARTLALPRGTTVMTAREVAPAGASALTATMRRSWDLAGINAQYRAFIARFAPVVGMFAPAGRATPEQAFLVRTLLIHAYRRVTLHDPRLPSQLLPRRWHAQAAYALCRDFYRLTHKDAQAHLVATLQGQSGRLPPAAPYFHERFGGLG